MTRIKELIANERSQYLALIGLSLIVLGLTGAMYFYDHLVFQLYFGSANPLIVTLSIICLGFICLSFLLSRGWFSIFKKGNLKGQIFSSGLAALFASIVILIDLKVAFPDNLNILFPNSLLFYPAIGFLVEILFHVLPLSLLLIFLTSISEAISFQKIIWPCILIVFSFEPIYQTVVSYPFQYPLWVITYIGFHVFLINLVQLFLFKRYDFISMYLFRLEYYLFWYIIWGHIRLKLLF